MEQLGQTEMDQEQRQVCVSIPYQKSYLQNLLQVVCISQDSFYRDLTPAEEAKAKKGLFNFDHPDAFNEELMYNTLTSILQGKIVEIPTYDYRSNSL